MMRKMTSKERMLAAFRREDADRVPVPQDFWIGLPPEEEAFSFNSLEDEISWKRSHGFDPYVHMPSPVESNPGVKQRSWTEKDPSQTVPILCSEWTSPHGTLSAEIRKTDDYPGDRVSYFGDWNTSRYTKPLLCNGDDMMAFVAMDPLKIVHGESLREWRQECQDLKCVAEREGIAICCDGGTALDYLIWGSTAERAIMLVLDYPQETMAFLKYLNKVSFKALELSIEAGADFVIRRGWYDSTDLWNPQIFTEFAAPFIQTTVNLSHQAALPCCYLMCTGIMALLPELAALDFDCLMGIEPLCTGQDMPRIVEMLGRTKSFWTGLSAPLHIGRGTTEEVRRAVRLAFDTFGGRDFLLSAAPSIRRHWPWENVEAMMDEYRQMTRTE